MYIYIYIYIVSGIRLGDPHRPGRVAASRLSIRFRLSSQVLLVRALLLRLRPGAPRCKPALLPSLCRTSMPGQKIRELPIFDSFIRVCPVAIS